MTVKDLVKFFRENVMEVEFIDYEIEESTTEAEAEKENIEKVRFSEDYRTAIIYVW